MRRVGQTSLPIMLALMLGLGIGLMAQWMRAPLPVAGIPACTILAAMANAGATPPVYRLFCYSQAEDFWYTLSVDEGTWGRYTAPFGREWPGMASAVWQ